MRKMSDDGFSENENSCNPACWLGTYGKFQQSNGTRHYVFENKLDSRHHAGVK